LVIEHFSAGGHNAPPRGKYSTTELGEPVYSDRDTANLERIRDIGVPFWLAGGYHSPEKRAEAHALGAAGVQVGSLFALTDESGLRSDLKKAALLQWKKSGLEGIADTQASPTGFPFRVVALKDTSAEKKCMLARTPKCNIGALLSPYFTHTDLLSYRCPAEPTLAFKKKGGEMTRTEGVVCLCNALLNASELGEPGSPATLTLGSDCSFLSLLLKNATHYTVCDAMHYLQS
jgi:NAD(P)H-dependent flavin oxidoreductase YrpB (nitropropane dioxygenase family)